MRDPTHSIEIVATSSAFTREKLLRPFGFKGGYLTELWQVMSKLRSSSGNEAAGCATQSVLYGDAELFRSVTEGEGNMLMYEVTTEALKILQSVSYSGPVQLFDLLFPLLNEKAKTITRKNNLNSNFVYNSMVSIDHASWLLYAAENRISSFDEMIPDQFRPALSFRNRQIAIMFQVPYGMPMQELSDAADQGFFVMKIKTGAPGSQVEMLEADMQRLSLIHETLKHKRTAQTSTGLVYYTMDANARYEKKETLIRYLDHARSIGAFDRILLYEEPLVETNEDDVADLGLRIAADESVSDVSSARKRIDQGYTAIVLKAIAKTLSSTLKIAKLAYDNNIPCLCSDLTVNPLLVDWHKNLAARLAAFPGISMGLMETNGDMNYVNWNKMLLQLPYPEASWVRRTNGVFELDDDFYLKSGGIFDAASRYSI